MLFRSAIKALELFSRYVPGHLTVQTRSPLLVIALPVLKRLGSRVTVSVGIETNDEQVVNRYTPGLPRIEERLKMVTALRRFGIETSLQIAPLLPYGEWNDRGAASKFAELLIAHGDFITMASFHELQLFDALSSKEFKDHGTVLKLAEERKFHWLRVDAAKHLRAAITIIDEKKLQLPERGALMNRQLNMFAA